MTCNHKCTEKKKKKKNFIPDSESPDSSFSETSFTSSFSLSFSLAKMANNTHYNFTHINTRKVEILWLLEYYLVKNYKR